MGGAGSGPKPKLTTEQAAKIREDYLGEGLGGGTGMAVLAQRHGVSVNLIHKVLTGKHPSSAGLPNIAGRRKSLPGWEHHQSARVNEWQAKTIGVNRVRFTTAERRMVPCPMCGAKPGHACTALVVGSYPRPLRTLHAERRPNSEVPS